MTSLRQQTAFETSPKTRAATAQVAGLGVLVGLDGFVDEIIAVVDKRHDFHRYQAMTTIDHPRQTHSPRRQASRAISSWWSSRSSWAETVRSWPRPAGRRHPTDLCRLLRAAQHPSGICRSGSRRGAHDQHCRAGHTDALEFNDGKVMLGKHATLKDICWERLMSHVSQQELIELMNASALVAMVNWTMLPHMSDIWSHLASEIFPKTVGRRKCMSILPIQKADQRRYRGGRWNCCGALAPGSM